MLNEDPTPLYERAFELLRQNRLAEVIPIANELRTRFPEQPGTHTLCGHVAMAHGNYKAAETDVRKGIELNEHHAPNYVLLAEILAYQGGREADAIAELEGVMSREPGDAELHSACGRVFTIMNDAARAVSAYQKAVEIAPSNATAHYNLAAAHRFSGDLPAAEASANKALELRADHYMAAMIRSDVATVTGDHNYVDDLRARLSRPDLDDIATLHLNYSLAKELEALGRYDEAFDAVDAGAKLQRDRLQYSVQNDIRLIDEVARAWSSEEVNREREGCDSDRPIFIVGLPRTGTTLLERMLQSHSLVSSAGEPQHFGALLAGRSQSIAASTELDLREVGQAYVEGTGRFGGESPRLVDKLPTNFLYLGPIAAALPNASIIHVSRHPMDTAFAIYKTLFAAGYPYSYDLKEIGAYYCAYRRLMAHWRSVLPERILDVRYEDLVTDTEGVLQRVAQHCGIDFEPEMLNYTDSDSLTLTASAAQVRQPVHSMSVGKWREVEKRLEPFAAILLQFGYTVD